MKKLVFGLFVFCCAVGMLAGGSVWAASDDAVRPLYVPTGVQENIRGMIVNAGGQGDALIAPIYKASRSMLDGVNNVTIPLNFVTYFTIANNSNTFSRISVRLRSGKHSIEVWDNYFTLSPHDVIWFQVEVGVDGTPTIAYEGASEPEPLNSVLLKSVGFVAAEAAAAAVKAGFTAGTAAYEAYLVAYYNLEMITGEIEVIGVGSSSLGNNTEDGVLFDCPNVLLGNVFLGDFTNGVYMGYQMTAIKNFRTDTGNGGTEFPKMGGSLDWNDNHRDGSTDGFIDEGLQAYFHPDWATTRGPTLNDGDDVLLRNPMSGDTLVADSALWLTQNWSIDDVESALTKTDVNSTYFNTGHSGKTYTGLWVTFPTKYLHYGFQSTSSPSALTGRFPVGFETEAQAYRKAMVVAPLGVRYDSAIYNLVEDKWSPSSPSLAPPFPWQVNFVPIGDISQKFFQSEPLLYIGDGTKDKSKPFNAPAAGAAKLYKYGYVNIHDFEMVDSNTWGPYVAYPSYTDVPVNAGDIAINQYFVQGMRFPANYLPPLVLTIDYEMTNYLHTRAFAPQWDIEFVYPQS